MIEHFISLVGSYLISDILSLYLFPMICLGILYIFPSFVRSLCFWR